MLRERLAAFLPELHTWGRESIGNVVKLFPRAVFPQTLVDLPPSTTDTQNTISEIRPTTQSSRITARGCSTAANGNGEKQHTRGNKKCQAVARTHLRWCSPGTRKIVPSRIAIRDSICPRPGRLHSNNWKVHCFANDHTQAGLSLPHSQVCGVGVTLC